jgi:hypothetical protein
MADIRATTTQAKKTDSAKGAAKKVAGQTSGNKETASTARKPIAKKAATTQVRVDTKSAVTPEERQKMIAEAAFLRAEQRGFAGGDPTDDWLRAEADIDKIISRT